MGSKKGISSIAAAQMQMWALLLSVYRYVISYRSTLENANASCLTRLLFPQKEAIGNPSNALVFNIAQNINVTTSHK